MSKKLGELLKAARTFRDVSLREVENKTKISNAYLSQMESGLIHEPSPHKLHKLAQYYDINYADLMSAAGYAVEGSKASSANTMLLASESLTESESAAVAAFIKQLRIFSGDKKK